MAMRVPAGIISPSSCRPPGRTLLGKSPATGGLMRIASSRQARRYSQLESFGPDWISSTDVNVVRSSCLRVV